MFSKALEFFFDFGSPASYLAWTQVPRIRAATGATVIWRPMLLGGLFNATGNASPAMVPAKGLYMLKDLPRFARRYGVEFRHNTHFPINTLTLMRIATGVQHHAPEKFDDVVGLIFRAMWVDGRNLGDSQTLISVLAQGGHMPGELLAWADEPEVKAQLKAVTDEAVQRGAFGAPTFFVDGDMFFGQDRLDFVQEALMAP